ncbi:hypothetical protein [Carnobacterium sp. ISL-102]|uniref:hypothetical protein n=1 Tax=Carnobacterium sp. ISL-102 TaxID=2819142 RepID=UPI001BE8E495|nr:hypothetical protein [Carnobacterium sp. ISL-102]MBT2731649.1 hypothetical protein [Carnobacterium sp. ISL-102]
MKVPLLILYALVLLKKGASKIMILNCTVCNQSYETIFPNKKYCSDVCAKHGRKNKRKEWEKDTNYNEKQRLDKMAKRHQIKEVKTAEEIERLRLKKSEIDQKHAERIKNQQIELEEMAKSGDPSARMRLAKPNSLEYWKAYQQSESEQYNQNKRFLRLINDISVLDEYFAEKVVESIKEKGYIRGHTMTIKN